MAVNINIPSQVSQTITDGVTDKAPSENAVFDALALKANTADLGATAFSNDYNDLDNLPTIPSVTGFVPYTGATQDLDMGTHNVTADHIALNTNPSGAGYVEGATQWNNTAGSSETLLKGGSVSLKNGVDLVARIVNKVVPNTTLTKANYQAVKVSGATGGRLSVGLAQANTDLNSADTIGLVTETIATNQEGFIITVGQLENINTTGSLQGETWADGDVLYLSPTVAGKLTNVKPTGATGHIVVIGYVEYAHANNGKIYVKIMNGWELDELHNVYINPSNLADNNLLQYDSATQLWKNESLSTAGIQPTLVSGTNIKTINGNSVLGSGNITIGSGITIGTTAITSGTAGRILFEGTGNVVQQDAGFLFDSTNKTLTNYGKGATSTNTSFGLQVFQNGTGVGTQNTSFGWGTGSYLTTGSNNTFVGFRAGGGLLASNFTGSNNTLIGASAGLYLSTGIQNTFVGGNTGVSITTGGYNTIIGHYQASLPAALAQNVIISDGLSQVALWMDSSQRVGFGYNPISDTLGAKVDIKAQGALSTDIAFRVRNSANNANLMSIQGDGVLNLAYLGDNLKIGINSTTSGQGAVAIGSGNSGLRTVSVGYGNTANGIDGVVIGSNNNAVNAGSCGIAIGSSNTHLNGIAIGTSNAGALSIVIGSNNTIGGSGATNNNVIAIGKGMTEAGGDAKMPHTFMFGSYATTGNKAGLSFRSNNINHLLLGYDIMNASYSSTNGTNWMGIKNGTAPDGAVDAFQFYSADITAGNAAPHFRTENGNIIKLFRGAALTASDGTLANAVTRIAELEARLQAHGLIA